MLKRLARSVLNRCGLEVRARATLPVGLSLERDLQRIFAAEGSRVFFDVGANTGQTAERFVAAVPSAQVWCFEPIANTFATLTENVRRYPQVKARQLALGDRDGEADMLLLGNSEWNRLAGPNEDTTDRPHERVRLSTLDAFCTAQDIHRIDLLKTDCEGHDLDVLRGAVRLLSAGQIGAVLCEVNFRHNGMHGDFFALHDCLYAHGFYFYALYDYGGWGPHFADGSYQNALWLRRPAGSPT